jgi:hypothetical protein
VNVLAMGINLWQERAQLACYASQHGHEIRTLAVGGENADYGFDPFEDTNTVLARIGAEWPVDLLLCGCPELYPPPLAIERVSVRTAAVISDWNLYQPQLEYNLCRFDVVLSDRLGTQALKLHDCQPQYWGPLYSQRSLVHRDFGLERDIDIGFFGNLNPAAHPKRTALLERIRTLSDRWRVEISGEHSQQDYARLLNRTHIAFNASLRGEMNLRCFEAPACGALLFIERGNLEAGDWLKHGESAVFYGDDDLLELLDHYLSHDSERMAIARRGQKIIEGMAAERRMDGLIDYLMAQPAGARPFTTLDAASRHRAKAMFYSSSLSPAQQRYTLHAIDAYADACPNDPAAHLMAGCWYFDLAAGQQPHERRAALERVFECFTHAVDLAPDHAAPALNLGTALAAIGAKEQARAQLHRAAEAPRAGDAACVLGKRSDPAYIQLRWNLATGGDTLPMLRAMALQRIAVL